MISLQSMLHTEQKAQQKNAGHETRSRKFALRIMIVMSSKQGFLMWLPYVSSGSADKRAENAVWPRQGLASQILGISCAPYTRWCRLSV